MSLKTTEPGKNCVVCGVASEWPTCEKHYRACLTRANQSVSHKSVSVQTKTMSSGWRENGNEN